MKAFLTLLAVCLPWISKAATIVAASTSFEDVGTAYTNSSAGDTITIPAGASTWTKGLSFTKASLTFTGQGTNNTIITFTQTGNSDPPFQLRANWIMVQGIQFKGPASQDNAQSCGLEAYTGGDWYRVKSNFFLNCFPRTEGAYGVTYLSVMANGDRMGRVAGPGSGQSNFDCCYPFNPCNTNLAVWEDCIYSTTVAHVTGAYAALTSQQGALWMVRNCTINCQQGELAPVFDSHGGFSGALGNVGIMLISNKVTMAAQSGNKLVDQRGGASLITSNTFTGYTSTEGIYLRRDDNETAFYFPPSGQGQITNSFMDFNTGNAGARLVPVVEANDASIIVLGWSYQTNLAVPFCAPAYPFPVRDDSGAPPTPSVNAPRYLRVNGVRLKP